METPHFRDNFVVPDYDGFIRLRYIAKMWPRISEFSMPSGLKRVRSYPQPPSLELHHKNVIAEVAAV